MRAGGPWWRGPPGRGCAAAAGLSDGARGVPSLFGPEKGPGGGERSAEGARAATGKEATVGILERSEFSRKRRGMAEGLKEGQRLSVGVRTQLVFSGTRRHWHPECRRECTRRTWEGRDTGTERRGRGTHLALSGTLCVGFPETSSVPVAANRHRISGRDPEDSKTTRAWNMTAGSGERNSQKLGVAERRAVSGADSQSVGEERARRLPETNG